ncbi:caspase family protein [Leisingera methylohalidivorans]|uniref:Peptidase C14, caspase catalytic subunit p20 n=1 Tax=Leisingera methylohalidivorans DSM 14336 TaxID=999552 RepID=V9VXF5_9RHOB|nr:caspase family protein [Leisingera methylohalidivorans]AHD01557.1 peptidase C14, caspase catalytic subunit p20 [Leisingera methylohalidivorans DSM 14336]
MRFKLLSTFIICSALALTPAERVSADAGDFAAGAIIGGIIGGALSKNQRRSGSKAPRRSRLPSTQEGRQIQESLNYFSFPAGAVDGQLGRKTREAVSAYQAYLGYPVTGQLNDFEKDLLISSFQRAQASGYLASQQAMAHPDGPRGLLKIYLAERLAPQPQPQQPYGLPQAVMAGNSTGTYGVPQQYGQSAQQQYGQQQMGFAATTQAYGIPQQPQLQGQQGQFVPQSQVPGQFVPQDQLQQQSQFVQQGQVMAAAQGQAPIQNSAVVQGSGTAATPVLLQQNDIAAPLIIRRALVIGVDGYQNLAALQKARNDALAVSNTLGALGFEVTTLYDAGRRDINSAVSTFANQIKPGDEVLFYFAGHGVEVDGRNYLLPSDVPMVNFGDESFLTGESIAADRVLGTFQRKGARSTIMILDACRNNPFPKDGQRSVGGTRGLVRMEPPEGAFILYSAGTGQTALDRLSDNDANPNSVFTRALLTRLNQPGMTLHQLAKQVRRDVQDLAATVNHDQFPAYYDQMSGEMVLRRQLATQGN